MRRTAVLSLLLSLCLFAPGLASAQSVLEQALAAEVARTAAASGALGVNIVELDTGETVFSHRADEPRVIASNSKLFTTAAALDTLGPGYLFETRLLMRGAVDGGTLRGDLGVVGAGDPQISGREYGGDSFGAFRPWAAALRARGVQRVTGDLYLASGLFEPTQVHPEWPRNQLTDWYEAPIASLAFSDNCILVRVSPGAAGQLAMVETVPPVPIVRVDNTALTTSARRGTRLLRGRTGDLLTVRGSIDAGSGPFETWVTVPDPVLYFGLGLRGALAEEGITVDGAIRPMAQLPGAVWDRVAVHRSDLVTAITTTNKRSQNFYAETLSKILGAARCGEGSWSAGTRAIGSSSPRSAFRRQRPPGGRLRHEPQQSGFAAGDHDAAAAHVLPPRGGGVRPVAPLWGRGHEILEAAAGGPPLPGQRLRQDGHAQRRLGPLGLRQGGVRQVLRLLDRPRGGKSTRMAPRTGS